VRATLHDRDLHVDAAGRFELVVEHGGIASGEETALIAAQYFTDRRRQAAIELQIERIGSPLPASSPSARLAAGLERARAMVEGGMNGTVDSWRIMAAAARHRFVDVPAFVLRPRDEYRCRILWFHVSRGESLLLRGRVCKARYFGLTLHNAWLESLDSGHLNHATIRCDDDGSFAIAIGDTDPGGGGNWLDTAGHEQGYLTVRALLPEEELYPMTVERVAKESSDGQPEPAARAV
jgi:hypothetical protein